MQVIDNKFLALQLCFRVVDPASNSDFGWTFVLSYPWKGCRPSPLPSDPSARLDYGFEFALD